MANKIIPEIEKYLTEYGTYKTEDEPARETAVHKGRTLRKPDREKRREDRRVARVRHMNVIKLRKARISNDLPAQEEIEKLLRIG